MCPKSVVFLPLLLHLARLPNLWWSSTLPSKVFYGLGERDSAIWLFVALRRFRLGLDARTVWLTNKVNCSPQTPSRFRDGAARTPSAHAIAKTTKWLRRCSLRGEARGRAPFAGGARATPRSTIGGGHLSRKNEKSNELPPLIGRKVDGLIGWRVFKKVAFWRVQRIRTNRRLLWSFLRIP